jgi:hypothetical protein
MFGISVCVCVRTIANPRRWTIEQSVKDLCIAPRQNEQYKKIIIVIIIISSWLGFGLLALSELYRFGKFFFFFRQRPIVNSVFFLLQQPA